MKNCHPDTTPHVNIETITQFEEGIKNINQRVDYTKKITDVAMAYAAIRERLKKGQSGRNSPAYHLGRISELFEQDYNL